MIEFHKCEVSTINFGISLVGRDSNLMRHLINDMTLVVESRSD